MATIKQLLQKEDGRVPLLDAELLLAHVLGRTHEYLFTHSEERMTPARAFLYRLLVFRRRQGVPVAYLTQHKEFFGLDFFVNRHVLVPRPETELLVELALGKIRNQRSEIRNWLLIDVGTGSGCIPIAILKNTDAPIKTFAIDASKKAISVAKRNARSHGADIEFLHGNLLEPIVADFSNLPASKAGQTSDFGHVIITANLPYLTPEQYAEEPSIQHEPRAALVGGPTGLEPYEELLKQLQQLATSYQLQATSYLEIDPSQSDIMKRLVKKYLPNASVKIIQDLAKRDRVVCIDLSFTILYYPPQKEAS